MRESVPAPVYPISGEPVEGAAAQATGDPGAAGRRPPAPQRAQSASAMLRGIENRVVSLPIPAKDFADLATGAPGVLYILATEWPPSPTFGTEPTRTLYKYELANPSELTKLAENVDDFTVTFVPADRYLGDWTATGVSRALDAALGDPEVDLVAPCLGPQMIICETDDAKGYLFFEGDTSSIL